MLQHKPNHSLNNRQFLHTSNTLAVGVLYSALLILHIVVQLPQCAEMH